MPTLPRRFSMRALLVALTLTCAALAPLGQYIYQSRVQKQAVARLRLHGASLVYQLEDRTFHSLRPSRSDPNPKWSWVARRWGIDFAYPVIGVKVHRDPPAAQDGLVDEILRLPHLESINLQGVKLTTAEIARFAELKKLRSLRLSECVLDEGPLELLADLDLTALELRRTHVSDRSIRSLQHNQSLVYLNLDRTKVSDASVPLICGLKNLKSLYIGHSKVTKAGALQIKRALPDCEVRWAPLSKERNIADYVLTLEDEEPTSQAASPGVPPAPHPRP